MARKIFSAFILLMFLSCKQTQTDTDEKDAETNKSQNITEKDISNLNYLDFSVDEKVKPLIRPWQEYAQLQDIINNLKAGDLSYFKTNGAKDNIRNLLVVFKEHIPDTINTPSIAARITVVETTLYKTESLSNLSTTSKKELIDTIKELLVSFSNLNFQMNKKLEKDAQNIEKPQ